jgi:hypothetical protein
MGFVDDMKKRTRKLALDIINEKQTLITLPACLITP